jgi:predicted nuclease of restriction endonuclease-like (RecB) superfamily
MKKSVSKATGRKSHALKPKGTILPTQPAIGLPQDYVVALAEIKQRVHRAQVRASLSANVELVSLYWDIGRMILNRQSEQGWGAKVIDRLAADLQAEFPGRQGFSPRNLKYMRAFAEAWPEGVLGNQTVSRSPGRKAMGRRPAAQSGPAPIVQAPLAQLPWYHHTILLNKLQNPEERGWYAQAALDQGWSGNILALQIDSGLHLRQGKATTNFKSTLPPDQSDLAQSVTKDPYLFDFLGLTCPTTNGPLKRA